MESPKKKDYYT